MAAQIFCPRCNQVSTNPAWDICDPCKTGKSTVAPPPTAHTVPTCDWGDGLATLALSSATITSQSTLNFATTLGGTNGLPGAKCLAALYDQAKVPGTPYGKKISFCAYFATAFKKDRLIGKSILAETAYSTGDAADCAEDGMWAAIRGKLAIDGYLAMGQSKCPCALCRAKYRTLAIQSGITIIVAFSKGYDNSGDGNALLFSPNGSVYLLK